jgi:hypothetical protein
MASFQSYPFYLTPHFTVTYQNYIHNVVFYSNGKGTGLFLNAGRRIEKILVHLP